jgi:S-adenosylmethionine hydrolase
MSIITLTTDYGLKDHFVGALKGKILTENPEAKIVDISHNIEPFNTVQASYIIGAAYNSFPKGTVHLIGVDAEKNKENQHIAMQWNDHFFICADNGTDLDVFITVASHLSKGGLLNVIGKEITAIKEVTEIQPSVAADKNSIKGYVIYIDHFGNVVTNISKKLFIEVGKGRPYEIPLLQNRLQKKSNPIKNIWAKYSDIGNTGKYPIKDYEGDKLAIFNEAGFLEIAIFRSNPLNVGSASSLLGLNYRDSITIQFNSI